MANVEAFNQGFDAGMNKKKSSKASKNVNMAKPPSAKNGGKIKKTGLAKVHKGEVVLTVSEAKAYKGKNKKNTSRKRVASKG